MPGRKYSAGSDYRYGFNGQEKSDEIFANSNTAEFWEYDSRIGRRWNIDPVFKEFESPYACLSDNPISQIDPNGGSVWTSDPGAVTFKGETYVVGKKNIKVQPPNGTLKSFTVRGNYVKNGGMRFVAKFDTETGAFTGYGWDQDLSYSYDDLLEDFKKDFLRNEKNKNDPMWDPNISSEEAKKNVLNLALLVAIPAPALRTAATAANATKTTQSFESFAELKKVLGPAGEGKAWHHIVEQNPANLAKFGNRVVQNTDNVIAIEHGAGTLHARVSGYYSSIQPFTNGQTVRRWLSGQSFQEQYQFGIKILKQFGWKP